MTKEARIYFRVKTINGVGRTGQVDAKKMKLDHQHTACSRTNSKWIKDLNISCDNIKILEEDIGSKMSDISCSNIFADISPMQGKQRWNKQMELQLIKKLLHS